MTNPNDTFVIVPTYNEADNLPDLLQQLLDLPVPVGVIVVDDNSADGTGKLADDWAAVVVETDVSPLTNVHRRHRWMKNFVAIEIQN